MNLLLLVICVQSTNSNQFSKEKPEIDVKYPVSHLIPTIGSHHKSELTQDSMVCFGNRDFQKPSYKDTFMCMLPLPEMLLRYAQCDSIWGSRSVVVTVHGRVEFLQVPRLPQEADEVELRGKRWLNLQSLTAETEQREIKHIPAEPFYLCARSIDWRGGNSSFQMEFRPVYLRKRDFNLCTQKILLHLLLVAAVSSLWFVPYIASFVLCVFAYTHGMHRFMVALGFSSAVVCFAPLMLTTRNRQQARLYIDYFFGRRQARETRESIRERLPLFQALFFSCALMCTGSTGSYIIYSYCGVTRDLRDMLIRTTMGVSTGWFVFVLCRSFESFFHQWSWLVLTACLLQFLEPHLNPKCYMEAVVAVVIMTLAFDRLAVPHFKLNQNISKVRSLLGMDSHLSLASGSTKKLQELFSPVRAKKQGSRNSSICLLEGSGSWAKKGLGSTNATQPQIDISDSKDDSPDDWLPSEELEDTEGNGFARNLDDPSPSSLSASSGRMNITVNVQVERSTDEKSLVRIVRAAVKKAVEEALE